MRELRSAAMRTRKDMRLIVWGGRISHLLSFLAGVNLMIALALALTHAPLFVLLGWCVAGAGCGWLSGLFARQVAVMIDKTGRLDEVVKPGELLAHDAAKPGDGESK